MEPLSFALTDTHKEFRASVRQLAEARIAPHAAEVDRDAAYPWDGFKACVDLELPSLGLPFSDGHCDRWGQSSLALRSDLRADVSSTPSSPLLALILCFPVF